MDDKQRTAMHYACYYGHWDVVEFLLQAQGVEYSLTARDAASATPVTAAAMGGYFHIVEQLLPRLGPATTTRSRLLGYWGTALHAAARSGNQDVVAALVNLQDDLKDQPDMMGRLPLHLAAMQGNWEAVLELSSLSSKHTSEDYQGRNALHMACGLGKTDLVLKLL
ncbi:ankyrin repeat-containing domain protein, partial [Ilyonectria robusta]|uniref:ankyrin repeat-containing domain protein n=1 Tax=Ilyonectria robusta TaxID=1079257 RepID=UPI001E8CDE1B